MQSFFQITNPALTAETREMQDWEFFQDLVPRLVLIGLIVGTVIFFFVLMTGAIRWITAGANKQNVEAARNKIVQGIVGLVIMFFIFLLVQVVNLYLGVNIGNLGVPESTYGSCVCVDNTPSSNECTNGAVPSCDGDRCRCMISGDTPPTNFPNCGDGILQTNEGEQCDGNLLNGQSCSTVIGSVSVGQLSCDECVFDTSNCYPGSCDDCDLGIEDGCFRADDSQVILNCIIQTLPPECSGIDPNGDGVISSSDVSWCISNCSCD